MYVAYSSIASDSSIPVRVPGYLVFKIETRHVSDTWKCGSLSFIFTHPPEDLKKKKRKKKKIKYGHGFPDLPRFERLQHFLWPRTALYRWVSVMNNQQLQWCTRVNQHEQWIWRLSLIIAIVTMDFVDPVLLNGNCPDSSKCTPARVSY